jgi:hypothetical protein
VRKNMMRIMTGQYNVMEVEEMEVVFVDGDDTSLDDESKDSSTCVSLFRKLKHTSKKFFNI